MVGAGTAGCTLAARLTEDPALQVLLMEAGPPARDRRIWTPAAFPALTGSRFDWNGSTEPQEHLNGRRLAWPRGRLLGGSGAIGAMVHLRGCRSDYDHWRDLGNPGWGFDDLEPLWPERPSGKHAPPPNKLTEVFLEACQSRGIAQYQDFEGAEQEGAGLLPVDRVNGRRWNVVRRFLHPALKRGNLTVWTGVEALRVTLEGGRAAGVEYGLRGSKQRVQAAREVILCAGAVGSARLLLLSGVGPAAHLERLGIRVAADAPGVGSNLQDHLAIALRWTCPEPVSLSGTDAWRNRLRFRFKKEGPLASNLLEAGAFVKSTKAAGVCDLEILFAPVYSLERGVALPAAQHGFTLLAALVEPRSRGVVELQSADPREHPRIDPGYLSGAKDRDRLAEAAGRARNIVEAAPFAPYRAAKSGSADVSEIEETAVSLHYGVGTCRMGPDEEAVVDPALRVRGIAGLRVADASIMPVIPHAAPNATVIAIAEKAARLIRES